MNASRITSDKFRQTWEDYQRRCCRDGFIPLNRFCEGRDVPVQRLYEWLRRRKVSIKEFQAGLSAPVPDKPEVEAPFMPLSVRAGGAGEMCAEDVRIESPGKGICVSIGRLPVSALMDVIGMSGSLR